MSCDSTCEMCHQRSLLPEKPTKRLRAYEESKIVQLVDTVEGDLLGAGVEEMGNCYSMGI